MTAAAAIELRDLTVRYGDFTAVDSISLSIHPGELFGFLGPNGAGKTTTIKVLTCQLKPASGFAGIAGLDVTTQFDQIKPRFGYVPDIDNHFDEFTGRQNLEFFARLYNVPFDRIDHRLAQVELVDEQYLPARTYSKGMKKKLLLARELLHDPDVMFLDEPTANLDVHSARVVRAILRRRADDGKTVFITTHNMKEVEELCDRVAIINHGRLVNIDSPANLTSQHAERKVECVYRDDGLAQRVVFDLDDPGDRDRLAGLLRDGRVISLQSRDYDFHEVFLKLTGRDS